MEVGWTFMIDWGSYRQPRVIIFAAKNLKGERNKERTYIKFIHESYLKNDIFPESFFDVFNVFKSPQS
jgi:hypothetical protein